jgi:hypothetical protein
VLLQHLRQPRRGAGAGGLRTRTSVRWFFTTPRRLLTPSVYAQAACTANNDCNSFNWMASNNQACLKNCPDIRA